MLPRQEDLAPSLQESLYLRADACTGTGYSLPKRRQMSPYSRCCQSTVTIEEFFKP